MAPFTNVLAITISIPYLTVAILALGKYNFTKECPPSRCSADGPVVMSPFRLNSSAPHCGYHNFLLYCSHNNTVLRLPSDGEYNVTSIDYQYGFLTITRDSWSAPCPWRRNIAMPNVIGSPFFSYTENVTWLDCPTVITSFSSYEYVAGPISCLGSEGRFVYVANDFMPIWNIPTTCTLINRSHVYIWYMEFYDDFKVKMSEFNARPLASLHWPDDLINCSACAEKGSQCKFNLETMKSFCSPKDSHVVLTAGISFGVLSIILLGGFTFYLSHQFNKKKKIHRKVEHFLKRYRVMNPTRYTYNDLKKITNKFKKKLGYGRFGTVYKGELMNGIPVAVKILDRSCGDGEAFVNEVATIGRIHHINVVRTLGFCSEGGTRAIVYEFMENGSLNNYIFFRGRRNRQFSIADMLSVVTGIAEGIEYLHQGCDLRILHFDIKPHNILLDHSFTPKISDFGLSKLCPKDQSYVTISAARGTLGYLAPEMYSRNFGMVSYKSDVYSFGMMILEMMSGIKNIDPLQGRGQSDVYFPEWIYDQLAPGKNLCSSSGTENEDGIMQKLAIVALWCIQWSPEDRPSMTRVVQMLGEELKNLQMPPKPFMSS